MTIKKRLFISFALILLIVVFIIGVFFYTTYNLNQIHSMQKHRYDQLRRVENLKEYHHAFAWIVLDIITDKKRDEIVQERFDKALVLFKELNEKKNIIIENYDSIEGKNNLLLLFSNFEKIEILITSELKNLLTQREENFIAFNKKFDEAYKNIEILLTQKIKLLQNRLEETEKTKEDFSLPQVLGVMRFLNPVSRINCESLRYSKLSIEPCNNHE